MISILSRVLYFTGRPTDGELQEAVLKAKTKVILRWSAVMVLVDVALILHNTR